MKVGSAGSTSQPISFYRQTKEANQNASRLMLRSDSLNLSQAGMMMNYGKLNIAGSTAMAASETNAATNDPTVKTIQKSFEEMTQTLGELKTLSEMALNPELTDLERLDLQVKATELQTKLFKATHRLGLELYPGTGGHVSVERALSRIGWEEDKMMEFLLQAGEKIANGDYAHAGGGADISSLSAYVEPAEPPLSLTSLQSGQDLAGELWKGGEDISQTPLPDEGDPLSQEPSITDAALSGTTLGRATVAQTAGKQKPAEQSTKTVTEGGALTRLFFSDYRVSAADRLDQAEAEAANPTASWDMKTGILLTDLKSATLSVKRIEKQMENLEELKSDFDKLVKAMPPEGYGQEITEEGEGPVWFVHETSLTRSSLILVNDASPTKEGELRRPSGPLESPHDIRMRQPGNPLEAFAQKLDTVFKDEIFKELGYSMKQMNSSDFPTSTPVRVEASMYRPIAWDRASAIEAYNTLMQQTGLSGAQGTWPS